MIQINLIPDVKREYLRARVVRNTAISISIVIGLVAAGIVVLLAVVLGGQALREANIDGRIEEEHAKLADIGPLNEALTLQHQLDVVSTLNNNKTISSRMFQVLQAINPSGENSVKFTMVRVTPSNNQISLEGVAENGYPAAEALKKTIINTNISYKNGDEIVEDDLASTITDGEVSYGEDSSGQRVLRFAMTIDYNSNLFSNMITAVKINGPQGSIDVTDSKIGVPSSLFSVPANDIDEGDNDAANN